MAKIGGAFERVLKCFDTKAEFGRVIGLKDRQLVQRWVEIGHIPLKWAVAASLATGGKVTPLEIINESNRALQQRSAKREAMKEAAAARAQSQEVA